MNRHATTLKHSIRSFESPCIFYRYWWKSFSENEIVCAVVWIKMIQEWKWCCDWKTIEVERVDVEKLTTSIFLQIIMWAEQKVLFIKRRNIHRGNFITFKRYRNSLNHCFIDSFHHLERTSTSTEYCAESEHCQHWVIIIESSLSIRASKEWFCLREILHFRGTGCNSAHSSGCEHDEREGAVGIGTFCVSMGLLCFLLFILGKKQVLLFLFLHPQQC